MMPAPTKDARSGSTGRQVTETLGDESDARGEASFAIRPHILSNLAISRSRSEPCLSGKDPLRITLPLSGEPNVDTSANYSRIMASVGPVRRQTPLAPPVFMHLASACQECDRAPSASRLTSSGSSHLCRGKEPYNGIAGCLAKITDVSKEQEPCTSLKKPSDYVYGAENAIMEREKTCNVVNNSSCPAYDCVESSRTSEWDHVWTCKSGKFNTKRSETKQDTDVPQHDDYTSANEYYEEDASHDGYFVLDEQNEEQHESRSHTGDGSMLDHVPNATHNYDDKESSISVQAGTLNGLEEEDIWSDEHFVFPQAKGFPPPISILAIETHPGLPTQVPRTLWRSVKRNGRFVLKEIQARPREFFQATRKYGRLRLWLVCPGTESAGSYTETVLMKDTKGSLELPERGGGYIKTSEVCQEENFENSTSEADRNASQVVKSSISQRNDFASQEELRRGPFHGKDGDAMSPNVLPDNNKGHGTIQPDDSVTCPQQRVQVTFGRRMSDDGVLKEGTCQINVDSAIERSAFMGVKVKNEVTGSEYGEGLDCRSSHLTVHQELKVLDGSDHATGMPHGNDEIYRQDYQHSCFSETFGFDNNINVLSSSQTLMQPPMQSAVR